MYVPWHAEQMALSFKPGFWANALEFLAEIRYGPRASLCPQHYQAFFHLELRWPGYLISNLSIQQSRDASQNEMDSDYPSTNNKRRERSAHACTDGQNKRDDDQPTTKQQYEDDQ